MRENPAPHWVVPTFGLVVALMLAVGLGALMGRGSTIADAPFPRYAAVERPVAGKTERRAPCQLSAGRDEADLCAQWRAARAAEVSAFWAKWSALIGIVGTVSVLAALFLAFESNGIARRTSSRQLRAYVSVDSIGMNDPIIGEVPTAKITFKNYGQTPAHKFDIVSYVAVTSSAERDPELTASNTSPTPSTLAPGGKSVSYPQWSTTWTAQHDHLYRTGKIVLAVFGYADYSDINDAPQVVSFKGFRRAGAPSGVTFHYPSGNSSS